ncbi:MAG: arginine--tRNA ligase [Ruminococcaceae bacterium]|nr:arginine--tRNA ligase [Oscillospiraceae bacterium]
MQNFKKITAEKLQNALQEVYQLENTVAELTEALEYPPDETLGDVAFPCFRYAKSLRMAPPKIASALAERISGEEFTSVTAAGGYVNFKISPAYLEKNVLTAVESQKENYGGSDFGKGKTVVLDYSSPNTSKPFHIGHLGTTVIGHCLKLLHQFVGYDCVGVNHLGDWGTQNGKQIVAFRKWGNKEYVEQKGCDGLVELYVKFHEEAEKDPSLNDEARAEFRKLEDHVPENIELWKWFLDISFKEYEVTYKQLGITFDSYKGESFYSDKMDAQIQIMRDKGLLKLDDGASIVDLSEYNMPPCLILKKDGSSLYPSRDIAAAVYRKNTYDFEKCIYVTSSAQSLHFAQWFKVLEMMGYDWSDKLVHVPYGTVSIGGEKLATRTGNVVLLKDLFRQAIEKVTEIMNEKNPDLPNKEATAEAVGVGAIVFNYLYNSRIKDINFTIESALSFDGSTGPYAQYTYARTCSILEKAAQMEKNGNAGITADEEAAVLKVLAKFPERVLQAIEEYEPCVIARYVIELCTAFNRFYKACPILSAEDENTRAFRLRITSAVNTVLATALHLICMKTPEKI